jgi:DMSO/TMAO reductase YedYZ molybdopterin-dependent catalytic subunit
LPRFCSRISVVISLILDTCVALCHVLLELFTFKPILARFVVLLDFGLSKWVSSSASCFCWRGYCWLFLIVLCFLMFLVLLMICCCRMFKSMTSVIFFWAKELLKSKILIGIMLAAVAGLLLLGFGSSVSASWTVTVDGAVDNPFSFTLDDFMAMPQTTVNSALLCDGAYVTSGYWTGVQLGYLLDLAGVQEGVQAVIFYASDGYYSNLPISASSNENIIIAYELNGNPLQETLRLVVPEANGEFWIAYITTIDVSKNPYVPPQQDMTLPVQPPEFPETPQVPTVPATPTVPSQPSVNQTTAEPAGSSSDEQAVQEEVSGGSSVPVQYGYPIIFAAVFSILGAAGYVVYDRRKNGSGKVVSEFV